MTGLQTTRGCWALGGVVVWGVLCSVAAPQADACIVRQRDVAEQRASAAAVVRARVVAVPVKRRTTTTAQTTRYRVDVEAVVRGEAALGEATLEFRRLRAIMVRGTVRCPLVDGSGVEGALEVGRVYTLYLSAPSSLDGPLGRLLVAEPVEAKNTPAPPKNDAAPAP